jgi:hypothetical protein
MNERLIDDYINEVTRGMGARQRDEVARELRTHILDSADALAAERKTSVDETIIREVIAKMGPAGRVAAMYPTPKTFLEMKGLREAILGLGGLAFAFLLVAGILWLVAPEALDVLPVQVIFSIAGALTLAIIVITIIFSMMYIYDTLLKVPYEARLKRLEKGLNDAGSPLKVFIAIFGTVIWLVLLNLFWSKVPFLASFGTNPQMVPLLSDSFAGFLPWFNLMGVLTIAVNLLYLAMARYKWVPSLLETFLSIGSALLLVWVLREFPFNVAELSSGIQAGAKVLLAIAIVFTLIVAAQKLWQTARFFLHGKYERGNAA